MTKTITMPLEEYEQMQKEIEDARKQRAELYRQRCIVSVMKGAQKDFVEQVEKSNYQDENGHPLTNNQAYQQMIEAVEKNSFLTHLKEAPEKLHTGEVLLPKHEAEELKHKTINITLDNLTINCTGNQKSTQELARELAKKLQQAVHKSGY